MGLSARRSGVCQHVCQAGRKGGGHRVHGEHPSDVGCGPEGDLAYPPMSSKMAKMDALNGEKESPTNLGSTI